MKKVALITGITGQDGSLLMDFLLKKKYKVIGIKRRASTFNTLRIDHVYDVPKHSNHFIAEYGDLGDPINISSLIKKYKPDEVYNLAAQSHVRTSFDIPEYTANINALGTLRILESIRSFYPKKKIKFYQASTSEIFGNTEVPQNERTKFKPTSPYAIAKLFSYWTTVNYREAYNIFAVNGILFNHEGPRRGETFVTKKITREVSKIYNTGKGCLYLGNLDAKRDWGSAKDYVECMWLMLQAKKPEDFVISTGKSYTVRKFVEEAFNYVGIKIKWKGKGLKEVGYDLKSKKILVKIKSTYFRPTDIDELRGDSTKARKILGWKPKTSFKQLVEEMMRRDLKIKWSEKYDFSF